MNYSKKLLPLILLSLSFSINGCTVAKKPTNARVYQHYNPINIKIENTAKSLLGITYKYGGNGPYQYDCSGFTKYVFSRQGISIPRVSRDQAKVGQLVRWNQLQKGDLIFFDSSSSSRVSHVGIYLGFGKFIHASSSKKQITISNINGRYYKKHFQWGRRLTNYGYVRR